MGRLRCFKNLLVARIEAAVANVLADRAFEQPRILQHHSGAAAQLIARHLARIHAVNRDRATVDLVKAHDEVDERRFTRPRGAHDRDRHPGTRHERQIRNERLFGRVGKAHVVESHLATTGRCGLGFGTASVGPLPRAFRDLLLGIQKLENALGRRNARLKLRGHRRELRHGLRELARILDEGLHITERELPRDDLEAAHERHRRIGQVPRKHHERHDERTDHLRTKTRAIHLGVFLLEARAQIVLATKNRHDLVAGERFLDLRVHLARRIPLLPEEFLGALADHRGNDKRERDHDQRYESENRRDHEHHDDRANHREARGDNAAESVVEGVLQVIHVVCHARQEVAAATRIEVAERHAVQLLFDVAAQPVDAAVHHADKHARFEPRERCREHVQDRDGEQNRVERAKVDPVTGIQIHARDHFRKLLLATRAHSGDNLVLRDASRQTLRDDAVEDDVGCAAEDLRADHAQDHREDADRHRAEQHCLFDHEFAKEPLQRRTEIARFLTGAQAPLALLLFLAHCFASSSNSEAAPCEATIS